MSNQLNTLESRYQINIENEIGDGSTARVFPAFDKAMNQKVALKVLNQEQDKSWGNHPKMFFNNEKNSLEKLCHENIVSLVSHGEAKFELADNKDEKSHFIALEFVQGFELIEFLQCKGAVKESIARHMFKPLVHAVQHIHSKGLVHRDIKSDNIMI